MNEFFANTTAISAEINTLQRRKAFYNAKKNVFAPGSFGSGSAPALSSYLGKIQGNYSSISKNASEVSSFLQDYINDIEGIERTLSGLGGGGG